MNLQEYKSELKSMNMDNQTLHYRGYLMLLPSYPLQHYFFLTIRIRRYTRIYVGILLLSLLVFKFYFISLQTLNSNMYSQHIAIVDI